MLKFLTVIGLLLLVVNSAEARQKRYVAHPDCNVLWPCEGVAPHPRGEKIAKQVGFGAAIKYYTPRETVRPTRHVRHRARAETVRRVVQPRPTIAPVQTSYRSNTTMLPHPEGCPRSLFCGCGAAMEVFGRPIRSLWLARNWYGFPASDPSPGKVAVRPHHVFTLKSHVSGDLWLVADHNSGGRKSRLHVRSIRGYSIRDPHGHNRLASL